MPDDDLALSYPYVQMTKLAKAEHIKVSLYPAQTIKPGEPEMVITTEVSANTENELKAKVEVIEEAVKGIKLAGPQTAPSKAPSYPEQAFGVLSSGGGLAWVGCYGPMSKWAETAEKGCILQDKYELSRSCYSRIMREGHFVGLRWMLPFDKGDPEMVKRIRDLCAEQLDMILEMGYLPYKTPFWAVRKLEARADANWLELHRRVKKMLDPNNILNPGRWGAPQE